MFGSTGGGLFLYGLHCPFTGLVLRIDSSLATTVLRTVYEKMLGRCIKEGWHSFLVLMKFMWRTSAESLTVVVESGESTCN
jgi:hypothetical protein